MKKTASILCAILIIFLAACNQAEETATSNKQETEENGSEEQEENNQEIEDSAGKTDEETAVNKEVEEAKYRVDTDTWKIVPLDEDADEKVALVTIDDAPDKHALEMAKTLKELDVNAVFFVNGHFLESDEEQEKLRKIHDMGFLIGNHTYSHPFLPDLTEEEQEEEIVKVNDMVEETIGERPKFFRAPNGANTDFTRQLADDEGMILMNWTYGYDWEPEYQSEEAIKDIMVNSEYLDDGANLLMHDREWTAAALHDIVTGLQDKGYKMVDPKLIKTKE